MIHASSVRPEEGLSEAKVRLEGPGVARMSFETLGRAASLLGTNGQV